MARLDQLKKLSRQLLPSGRAFRMPFGGFFEKLSFSLVESESRFLDDSFSILSSLLPDNSDFTTIDAAQWETRLGIITNESVSLDDRKSAISRKLAHPGTVKPRQNYVYLEGQLRQAGFDVYVHENRFGDYAAGFNWVLPESFFPSEGSDLIVNGSFLTASDWTLPFGTIMVAGDGYLTFSGAAPAEYAGQTFGSPIAADSGLYRLRIYQRADLDDCKVELLDGTATVQWSQDFNNPDETVVIDIDASTFTSIVTEIRIYSETDGNGSIEYVSLNTIIDPNDYPGLNETYYGLEYTNYIVNHVDPTREIFYDFGSNLKSTFFIGGQDLNDITKLYTDIDSNRIEEFRQLILRLKPAQTKAFLFINEI